MSDRTLDGTKVAVSGGAQGIGWAIAAAFAQNGATVHVCDVSADNLAAARKARDTASWASRITLTECDVSNPSSLYAWIDSIGELDVLVNNAAFIRWGKLEELTPAESRRTIEVGFTAVENAVRHVLPAMRQRDRGGTIINVGSSAAKVFVGGPSAAYTAMKCAIDGFTQILQWELRKTAVRVILVRPGLVVGTQFFDQHVPYSLLPRLADWIPAVTPEQVAQEVIRAYEGKREIVNVPRMLAPMYVLYEMAPKLLRGLAWCFGASKRTRG